MSKVRKASGPASQQNSQQQTNPIPVAQPTDAYIPPFLMKQIPELEAYEKLLDAERRIDLHIGRKKIDLYQSVSQLNAMKQETKEKQYLRVFISNISENQPWQTSEEGAEPSWTLRVEGRLVNGQEVDDPNRQKFSSFLQGIAVDFKKPEDEEEQPLSIVEWHADPAAPVEFDGLDVKRTGSVNVACTVTIQPSGFTGDLIQFSPQLAAVIGLSRGSLHDAIYSIYKYILLNDLLDNDRTDVSTQSNASSDNTNGEKTIAKVDKYLATLLPEEKSTIKLVELPALVNRHISPLPPVRVDYTVRVDKASTYGETVLDIEVPSKSDDTSAQEGMALLSELNQLSTAVDPKLQALNQELNVLRLQLNACASKHQFFKKMAEDPVPMLQEYVQSSSRALKILSGDDGFNEDTVRRASFYKENEAMLFENLGVLLSNGRM
ncbi:LAMI_0D07998g1_1 [Lachancea mirantina]|uniref:LAMI_0D07998g1_1 n=1 Tax=Lachancea mirantina TaxID=1230905 RepID=A0A1G4JCR3_9SACH|nr:LAMI_0D07998g1_1 [Lachancea mirantina]